ncbi:MAG: SDR family oxidoreductase, partial [Nanoarchaeota archaeon]
VFVTGSSTGIGRETAIEFSKSGAKIVISFLKNKKSGEDVLKECQKNSEAMLVQMDVLSTESVENAIKEALRKFGGIDVLINNAGILIGKMFKEQSLEELEKQIDINLKGLIKVTKLSFPYLERNEEAVIVNVSSMSGKYTHARHTAYGASKFGVRGFTKALADELPKNIRIYCVNPNLTATPMTNLRGENPKKVAEIILKTAKEELGKKSGEDIYLG